jgi:hypothetical protein
MSRALTVGLLGAVLVALGMPVLNTQLERARRAHCLRNLQQIGAAMHLYANDHRGWLPAVSALVHGGTRGPDEIGFDRHSALLLNLLYARSPAIFVCPSDKEDGNPTLPLSDDGSTGHARVRPARGGPPWLPGQNLRWHHISYLYVAGFTIRDRGEFLLLADEHWDSEGDCPAECRHDLDPFDNHGKAGRNVLYLDGRGDWLAGIRIDDAYAPILRHGANFRSRTVD